MVGEEDEFGREALDPVQDVFRHQLVAHPNGAIITYMSADLRGDRHPVETPHDDSQVIDGLRAAVGTEINIGVLEAIDLDVSHHVVGVLDVATPPSG